MKNNKKSTIGDIITFGAITLVWLLMATYGLIDKNYGFLIIGLALTVVFAIVFARRIVLYVRSRRSIFDESLNHQIILMTKRYNEIKDFGEVGYVSFIQQGVKFSAEGKFSYTKDTNRQPVYRFVFQIEGTKLVSAPDNYEDVLDYANNLFAIEIKHIMSSNSTETENNDNNIDDISSLTGKKLNIAPHKGYTAVIATAELDVVEYGEVTFEQWDDNEHIISFKLMNLLGINDIVVGKVQLSPYDDADFDEWM